MSTLVLNQAFKDTPLPEGKQQSYFGGIFSDLFIVF
jgi:hypothetical protein